MKMRGVVMRSTVLVILGALLLAGSAGAGGSQGDVGRGRAIACGVRDVELASVLPAPLLLDMVPAAAQKQAPAPADTGKADRPIPKPAPMRLGLDVLTGGRALATIQYQGKTYLPVPQLGAEYELRVWNHGPRRIAAVLSVDGLSVIHGRPASENDPGYLVAPYSHIVIKGWRRNMDTVAAFRFVDRAQSYAVKTGRPENIGVIGLVAIEEQVSQPAPALEKRETAGAARFSAQVGSIGTEYGREVDSRVYYVPFVRSANRRAITLYYDSIAALRAAGVPVDGPVAFPADPEFAPPPPGYTGK